MHPDHSNFSLDDDDDEPAYYVPRVGGCKSHTTQATSQLHVYKYIITILQLKGPSTGRFSDIHQFSPTLLVYNFLNPKPDVLVDHILEISYLSLYCHYFTLFVNIDAAVLAEINSTENHPVAQRLCCKG